MNKQIYTKFKQGSVIFLIGLFVFYFLPTMVNATEFNFKNDEFDRLSSHLDKGFAFSENGQYYARIGEQIFGPL